MKAVKISALFILILGCTACFKKNNIIEHPEWSTQFSTNQKNGCFMLLDNSHERFHVYNLNQCTQNKKSPAQSFFILSQLMGLESGVVFDTNMHLPALLPQNIATYQNLSNAQAFRQNYTPYFTEVHNKIGALVIQKTLDTVAYGNKKLKGNFDEFWKNDTLKITIDEQLGFIKRLYFDKLPFSKRAQRITRNLLSQYSDTLGNKVYYHASVAHEGLANNANINIVGFAEKQRITKAPDTTLIQYQPYFFASSYSAADVNDSLELAQCKVLVNSILNKMGVFK
jgi:beta-lactamase class D